ANSRFVLCDRYYLSSLVYQSDENTTMATILQMNEGVIVPNLTLFLSASNRTCYQRMRSREQSRELFETNLGMTRKKYDAAIALLRARGERIIEVSAEGSLGEVVVRVLNALIENSPSWLANRIHPRLILDDQPEFFEQSPLTIEVCAKELERVSNIRPVDSIDELHQRAHNLLEASQSLLAKLSHSDLGSLFLDIVAKEGYEVHERLPWTDLDAIELSYEMPLGIAQRGATVIMGKVQRYDAILPNIMAGDKINTLRRVSDFLLICEPNPSALRSTFFERVRIEHGTEPGTSPSIAVFGLEHLTARLVSHAIQSLLDKSQEIVSENDRIREGFEQLQKQYAASFLRPFSAAGSVRSQCAFKA